MKLLLAVPTYGPTYAEAQQSIRRSLMFAARHGVEWVDDISFDRESIGSTRTKSLYEALRLNVDGVIWCDDDMVVEDKTFYKLIVEERDLIATLAFERRKPYRPGAWFENPFRLLEDLECGVAAVDAFGFGCCYTSTKVLKAVGCFEHVPSMTEDRRFCLAAKAMGFQPYVDTSNRVGHIAELRVIDIRDYLLENSLRVSPTMPPERNP